MKKSKRQILASKLGSQRTALASVGKELAELAREEHKDTDENNIVSILGAIRLLDGAITKLESESESEPTKG